MEEKELRELRVKDIIASVILFIFGVFIIIGASQMPISANYAGIKNTWYVSPALLPFIIGAALIILSIVLTVNSLKTVGFRNVKEMFSGVNEIGIINTLYKERNLKYLAILFMFSFYVYLFIPNIDFFLATFHFLLVFMSSFYFEDYNLLKKLSTFNLFGSLLFVIYYIIGLGAYLEGVYLYTSDILFVLFIVIYIFYVLKLLGGKKEFKRKFNTAFALAIVVPVITIPVFKYILLVMLPKEGLVIELMNILVYDIIGL